MKIDELELRSELLYVFVFGPGYGESILVRSPPDSWLVVDSLRRQEQDLDLNPAVAALSVYEARPSAVVLTHPHQDHTRGLVQLLERRLPGSPVGCVPGFLQRSGKSRSNHDASVVLDDASVRGALNRIDHIWRSEPGSRWALCAGSTRSLGEATVEVLFPARIPARLPRDLNRLSSPLLLEWEGCRVVLGADLPRSGWKAVSRLPAALRVSTNQGLKVAHHGSRGAQHPIAIGQPPPGPRACIAAPFNKGRPLPSYEPGHGIDQLLASNRRVAVTVVPPSARGTDTSRHAMLPVRESFGDLLTLEYEQQPAAPQHAWVAAGFDSAGGVVGPWLGEAAGGVVA